MQRRKGSWPPHGHVGVVEQRRSRYAHRVGGTPRIMCEGMRADYRLVDRLSQELCERMPSARTLAVRTSAGTDFTATFDRSLNWVKTSGLINPRYWSNLPAGEVFTTPASVDGTFVCNGTAGDYFNAKYGRLDETPLVLEIQGGRLVSAQCDRADLQKDFWDYCHTDANAMRGSWLRHGHRLREMTGSCCIREGPRRHLPSATPYGGKPRRLGVRTPVDVSRADASWKR